MSPHTAPRARGRRSHAYRAARGIATAVILLSASAATQAASVSNRDASDQRIVIVEGSSQRSEVLKPGQSLDGICETGCLLRLNGDDANPYELQGSDVTSIEGGKLYIDGQVGTASPSNGLLEAPTGR